jgi:osmotically-inducible protein OsmY
MTEKPIPDAESGHDLEPSERRNSAAGSPDRYRGPLRRRDDQAEGGVSSLVGDAYYGEDRYQTARGAEAHRRSDESIQEEICELLSHQPGVNAGEIEVLVEGGEVTLQGSVEQRDARWRIEELVESVSGVSLVHNRVRIAKR